MTILALLTEHGGIRGYVAFKDPLVACEWTASKKFDKDTNCPCELICGGLPRGIYIDIEWDFDEADLQKLAQCRNHLKSLKMGEEDEGKPLSGKEWDAVKSDVFLAVHIIVNDILINQFGYSSNQIAVFN
jgi:hypothetical protein